MELAKKFGMTVSFSDNRAWIPGNGKASVGDNGYQAITRCAISSVYGETVTVEDA